MEVFTTGRNSRSSREAAVTIVSANYLSHAATLCQSFKRFHQETDFVIILVDDVPDDVIELFACDALLIKVAHIAIPDFSRMIYRYSIIELNTAVKPFVLSRLFEWMQYEKIIYLDPDIEIFSPLELAYSALDAHSIALTPHITRPYSDCNKPSDRSILLSGVYNLGFLGINNSTSAHNLLEWWKEKLFTDCVVDTSNGIFVDQRWFDLAPCFCPDHAIIFDPGYNTAYWNLHERRISRRDGTWYVGNTPLVFYHYSGFSPHVPWEVSKHQNRFSMEDLPEIEMLSRCYMEQLIGNGFRFSSNIPYAFEMLPNGTRLPMRVVRDVMQWASRNRIDTPDPLREPDRFCGFLMSRGLVPDHPDAILLYHFLLLGRRDLAATFPGALTDSNDPAFRQWLKSDCAEKEQLTDIAEFERDDSIRDYIRDAFDRLREAQRTDVFRHFANLWTDERVFDEFAEWFSTYGATEMNFTVEHSARLKSAYRNITRILNIYISNSEVQTTHPDITSPDGQALFIRWLGRNSHRLNLTQEDISLFNEYLGDNTALVRRIMFLYNHTAFASGKLTQPSVYDVRRRCRDLHLEIHTHELSAWLMRDERIEPIDHYAAFFKKDLDSLDDPRACYVPEMSPERNNAFWRSCRDAARPADGIIKVNFAGYLNAPTGMGECSRSIARALGQPDIRLRELTLPSQHTLPAPPPAHPFLYGWPQGYADISLTVANADACPSVARFLPEVYRARRNIGYWMWESTALPRRMAKEHAAYDEIWTASSYSARAIADSTGKATAVVPLSLNFEEIARARADRSRFGLPEHSTIFGFMFDPNSVLERKNIRAVIRAFRSSFRPDDNCHLVLKVNGTARGNYEYEALRAMADDRVLFTECVLSREHTFDFLKSLDVYVSLHRSEGFGLTCAEAMALGLPVIATGYSGNLDFMDSTNSILVPVNIIETDRAYGPYPAGTVWGDPDAASAGMAMRALLAPDKRRALGAIARQSIAQTLSPGRIADTLRSRLAPHVANNWPAKP